MELLPRCVTAAGFAVTSTRNTINRRIVRRSSLGNNVALFPSANHIHNPYLIAAPVRERPVLGRVGKTRESAE